MTDPDVYAREMARCGFELRLVEVKADGLVRITLGPWIWHETLVVDGEAPDEGEVAE